MVFTLRFAPNHDKVHRALLSKGWRNLLVGWAAGGADEFILNLREIVCFSIFVADKIYEARHSILQLTTPIVKPEIPLTYFAPNQETGLSYRRTLASMLSSYPESPLTPGVSNNFGLNANNSPFAAYQPKFNNFASQLNQYQQQQLALELPRLQNLQISPGNLNRFQSAANQNEKNFLAPNSMLTFPLPSTTAAASFSRGTSVSPIKSTPSANTSGYESFSSSATSLEQMYAPFQQNMQANSSGISAHFSPENQTFLPSNMSRRMSDSRPSFTFDNECRTPTPGYGLTVSVNKIGKRKQIDQER